MQISVDSYYHNKIDEIIFTNLKYSKKITSRKGI